MHVRQNMVSLIETLASVGLTQLFSFSVLTFKLAEYSLASGPVCNIFITLQSITQHEMENSMKNTSAINQVTSKARKIGLSQTVN